MSNNSNLVTSSLGKKLIMSLTGLFLCIFLIVHLIGNFQLFKDDGGQAFNSYSYFMTHFAPIKIVSYLLYLSIIVHAIYALILTIQNNKARGVGYAKYNGAANSTWSSRNMGILGTIILIFLVIHMKSFWAEYHWGELPYAKYEINLTDATDVRVTKLPFDGNKLINADYVDTQTGKQVLISKDLYTIVYNSFKQWWYVALYVLSMAALSFHLVHGFQSAFQSLGWNHNRYKPLINFLGIWVFSIIIPIAFAAMPLYIFFLK